MISVDSISRLSVPNRTTWSAPNRFAYGSIPGLGLTTVTERTPQSFAYQAIKRLL